MYSLSRWPGYLIHELLNTPLYALGGSVLMNFGSLCMSLLNVLQFLKVCKLLSVPYRHLLALGMVVHPVYWVASTSAIDFVWASGFFFWGYSRLLQGGVVAAGVLFGLAIGARLGTVICVVAVVAARLWVRRAGSRQALVVLCIAGTISVACYLPSFFAAGRSLGFLRYSIGDWTVGEHVARLVYKTIYFWGILAFTILALIGWSAVRGAGEIFRQGRGELFVAAGLVFAGIEYLFFKVPVKPGYLLPTLPFILMLAGVVCSKRPHLLYAFVFAILSYDVWTLDLARPDVPSHARSARLGVWLEEGYLRRDVHERPQTQIEQVQARQHGGALKP
jgi:hypothetical protein